VYFFPSLLELKLASELPAKASPLLSVVKPKESILIAPGG